MPVERWTSTRKSQSGSLPVFETRPTKELDAELKDNWSHASFRVSDQLAVRAI